MNFVQEVIIIAAEKAGRISTIDSLKDSSFSLVTPSQIIMFAIIESVFYVY